MLTVSHAELSGQRHARSRRNYEPGGTRMCLTCSKAVVRYGPPAFFGPKASIYAPGTIFRWH